MLSENEKKHQIFINGEERKGILTGLELVGIYTPIGQLQKAEGVDRLAALKEKMDSTKKKEANKQITVYLTPNNYRNFKLLKEKGEKSELINRLLDIYFEQFQ